MPFLYRTYALGVQVIPFYIIYHIKQAQKRAAGK